MTQPSSVSSYQRTSSQVGGTDHRSTYAADNPLSDAREGRGKGTSMSIACPAAVLYTHHMYKQIAIFQRTGGRKQNTDIAIAPNGGLRFELEKWLEVRHRMNGASWYKAVHQRLTIAGASDASSSGWGGLIIPGEELFQVAGDFQTNGQPNTSTCKRRML